MILVYFRLYDILGIYRVSKIMIEIIHIGKYIVCIYIKEISFSS